MPRYENIKVITGTPGEVQKKLNAAFGPDTHPNRTILSTAVTVQVREVVDEEEVARREKEEAKLAKKEKPAPKDDESGEAPPAAPEAATLEALPMTTVREEFMAVTIANVFP